MATRRRFGISSSVTECFARPPSSPHRWLGRCYRGRPGNVCAGVLCLGQTAKPRGLPVVVVRHCRSRSPRSPQRGDATPNRKRIEGGSSTTASAGRRQAAQARHDLFAPAAWAMSPTNSSFRMVDQLLQPGGQFGGKSAGPIGVDESYVQEVEEMHLVLTPERRQLHPHQRFQRQ